MTRWAKGVLAAACCAMSAYSSMATGDDDDAPTAASAEQAAPPTLNAEQQRAVGIVVARAPAMKVPDRIEALGLVLDATTLLSDLGEATAAAATERSASAELARLRGLYNGGAGASLKMLEAAQAEQARTQAQAQVATARFSSNWGPLAALPAGVREKAVEAAAGGRSVLVRADLPGRHSVGEIPGKAMLDVDGIQVPGRVLGALRQATDTQSAGLLVEVPNAPAGLGPGARVPIALLTAGRSGRLVPRDAVLYDENGAYVYKQSNGKSGDGKMRYAPVKVTLLVPFGDAWLVGGVDDDDDIVVHGAGVLWSLQGMGAQSVDDDD